MNPRNGRLVATACIVAGALGVAIPAGAIGGRTATCKGEAAKPTVHADATRREATLGDLVSKLQKRRDVFGLNGPQISTLQQASAGVSALDQQIASTCYPTLAAFRADAVKLFVGYRVYWLRVPQSHAIEAADRLGEVRARLGDVAAKLTTYAGSNEQAQVDLAAMHRALDAADAKLGTAPNAGPSIAAIAGLAPAADMTADEAALRAAHTDLVAIRSSLVDARSAAQRVVADLRG